MVCGREEEDAAELEDIAAAVEEEVVPTCVHAVDRLRKDVECLQDLWGHHQNNFIGRVITQPSSSLAMLVGKVKGMRWWSITHHDESSL
jgi:hypothetical protein